MFRRKGWVVVAFCSAAVACGESTTDVPPPALTVSPDTISIVEPQTASSLFLASGGQAAGSWQISSKPGWVTITPESGSLTGDIIQVQVEVDAQALSEPVTVGSIHVVSDAGSGSASVKVELDYTPRVSTSESDLQIGATDDHATLRVTNVGRSAVTWTLSSPEPWLIVEPSSGQLGVPGAHVDVTVTVDREPLPVGTAQATLALTTNGEPASTSIPLSVEVPPDPELGVSGLQLKYPGGVDTRELHITNTGKGDLEWSVESIPSWLSMAPSEGTLSPGASVATTVTVDRGAVPGGSATGAIGFASNAATQEPEVSVIVSDQLGPELGLIVLDHRVVDSEYDSANDRIVTLAESPARLYVTDVVFGAVDSVALPLTGATVAVDPAGAYAAVGHNGFVTLVALEPLAIEETFPVSADVFDVVLPGNGWIHAMPRVDQWVEIRSVEIATGEESLSGYPSVRAGTVVRLHPSGDYIYGADNGLSPSDIEKYDIRDGPASYMYDSPYHGDYAFSGNLWISEDGARIFARSAHVFRTSTLQSEDMLYSGTLPGSGALEWAVTSTENERAYVVRESPGTELEIFETGFLTSQGSVALEDFDSPGGPVESYGRFVFTHSDGSRIYVLVQADPSGGLAQDWGLLVLDGSTLP